jgi:hypothetical protein
VIDRIDALSVLLTATTPSSVAREIKLLHQYALLQWLSMIRMSEEVVVAPLSSSSFTVCLWPLTEAA